MRRAAGTAGLATALLVLAGCSTLGGQKSTAGPNISTEDFLASLPADRRQPIMAAETELRTVQQQAERATSAVALGEERQRAARAEVDARKAEVERARAQVDLVKKQHQAQLSGAPAGGDMPTAAQGAQQRLGDAEYAVETARWDLERAQAVAQLRERELAYAKAFQEAAQRQVGVKKADVNLAKAQVVAQNAPNLVEGVVDPRVARAQADLRNAQADYARGHADATQRLSEVQVQRRAMTRFDSGPPPRLPATAAGRSGAAQLAPKPEPVQLAPLPWPAPFEPQARATGDTSGAGTSGAQGTGQATGGAQGTTRESPGGPPAGGEGQGAGRPARQ